MATKDSLIKRGISYLGHAFSLVGSLTALAVAPVPGLLILASKIIFIGVEFANETEKAQAEKDLNKHLKRLMDREHRGRDAKLNEAFSSVINNELAIGEIRERLKLFEPLLTDSKQDQAEIIRRLEAQQAEYQNLFSTLGKNQQVLHETLLHVKPELNQLHAGITDDFEALLKQYLAPEPSLNNFLHKELAKDAGQIEQLVYRYCFIQFFGRDQEIAELERFLTEEPDQFFSWHLLSGLAGQGKSRLALKLCHDHASTWDAGFLEGNLTEAEWKEWEPNRHTLIVIDYAGSKEHTSGPSPRKLIQILADKAEQQKAANATSPPVRLLLLERDNHLEAPWLKDFMNFEVENPPAAFKHGSHAETGHYPSTHLGPLETEAAKQIFQKFYRDISEDDLEEALDQLRKMDEQGELRPLFIALAAQALHEAKQRTENPIQDTQQYIRKWDKKYIVTAILEREERIWRETLETRNLDLNSPESQRHLHLYLLSTLIGETDLTDSKRYQELAEKLNQISNLNNEPIFPFLSEALKQGSVYRTISSLSAGRKLMPMEPDIIGERFLIKQLAQTDYSDDFTTKQIIQTAWKFNPISTVQTLIQMLDDWIAIDIENWQYLLTITLPNDRPHPAYLYGRFAIITYIIENFDFLESFESELISYTSSFLKNYPADTQLALFKAQLTRQLISRILNQKWNGQIIQKNYDQFDLLLNEPIFKDQHCKIALKKQKQLNFL